VSQAGSEVEVAEPVAVEVLRASLSDALRMTFVLTRASLEEEDAQGEGLDVRIDLAKDDEAYEKARHGKVIAAQPVEITLGAVFVHEKHDAGAAIERRNRKEIKSAEKEIQGEDHKKRNNDKAGSPSDGIAREKVKKTNASKGKRRKKHEGKIGNGAGKGHPGGTAGVAAFPERIVGSAGPADHAAGEEKAEDGDDNHANGFTANVRHGIESHLAAEGRGTIAATHGDEGVSRLVASGREKKSRIPNEAFGKFFG
jgi:hypothetical protein